MDCEVIRSLMLPILKNLQNAQMAGIEGAVERRAKEDGLLDAERRQAEGISRDYANRLAPGESSKIREVIWEFIIQGVLTPGSDDSNPNLPFLRLTEWGRKCVNAGQIIPYDRDGYLARLKACCPDLNMLTKEYMIEALECFRRGCFLAAPVMLGCASEQIAILLMNAFMDAIQDATRKVHFERKMQDKSIKRRYDYFRTELSKIKLPPELADALDIQLDGVFTQLRYARNDTGHPTGNKLSRDEIFVNLGLFISYCERAYALMAWLNSNPV